MIRPGAMPRIRDQVARHFTPGHALHDEFAVKYDGWAETMRANLRIADLYWCSADMSALAFGASETLPESSWDTSSRPAPCGLMVFDGGISTHNWSERLMVNVEAMTWGPGRGGCVLTSWASRQQIAAILAERGNELVTDEVPPLIPINAHTVPIDRPVRPEDLDPEIATLAPMLASAWLLMQQPTLVDRARQHADRDVRRSYARAGRGEPDITYVTLRRSYVPNESSETGTDSAGRRYHNRWITSGHWREQFYPSRDTHERIWIPEHIKGPEGAPLLLKKRVNIWRR